MRSIVVAVALVVALPSSAAAAQSDRELYLTFDGSNGSIPNLASTGSAEVETGIASANGGTVLGVKHAGAGRAARLEPFDPESPAELATVVIDPAGGTDPFDTGKAPFAFGADFRLDEKSEGSDADNGNNLFQRGLYSDAAQYKLQIDGGRISCRVEGSAGSVHVVAGKDLRTERWHRVRCTRKQGTVTLRLVHFTADGPVRRVWSKSGTIGALTFDAGVPLSVGGKVDGDGDVVENSSDQFNGRIDDVFFRRLDG